MRLSPGTSSEVMSKVVSPALAAAAAAGSIVLPAIPTTKPLTNTCAKSSAATEMNAESGAAGRVIVLAKNACARSAVVVVP